MIVQGVEYDADRLMKYSKPKVNNSGGKNVGILNAESNKSTALSTPLMLTWGVNEWDNDSGKKSYDMNLQFPKEEYANDATTKFLENMCAFEAKLKRDAVVNSKEWFGKASMSAEVVDALFTPMLRYPKDPNTGEPDTSRAPTLRVKIPYWDDKFNVEVYDMEQTMLFPDDSDSGVTPLSLVQKGSNVAMVIQNGGIWFANGKFGTTWKMVQCVVKPKASLKGKCHIALAPEEKEKMQAQVSDEGDDEDSNVQMTTNVNDSDDDDAEVAPEPEPAKPAAPAKKRVVKKKKTAAAEDDE